MMQYTEKVINASLRFMGIDNTVEFRMDGRFRSILSSTLDITREGVKLTLTAGDARMVMQQMPDGWQVTEEKIEPPSGGRIHIAGSINSPNVNIGGTQIISGGMIINGGKDGGR
jgi:hypothetical protein